MPDIIETVKIPVCDFILLFLIYSLLQTKIWTDAEALAVYIWWKIHWTNKHWGDFFSVQVQSDIDRYK